MPRILAVTGILGNFFRQAGRVTIPLLSEEG